MPRCMSAALACLRRLQLRAAHVFHALGHRRRAWPCPSSDSVVAGLLDADLQARPRTGLFFAGQISGVEGYTESAATGLLAGLNAARLALGAEPLVLPAETMLGALCHYISHTRPEGYQPTNAAFGLLPEAPVGARKRAKIKPRSASRGALFK